MNPKTFHPILKPGDRVKCCGGCQATVICISTERILLHVHTKYGEKYITGHNPHVIGDGVVWDWGHYYENLGTHQPNAVAELLMDALRDYLNIKEDND